MTVVLEKFVRTLADSGLMSAEEIEAFIDELPEEERPDNAEDLAKLLYRHKKLTRFQTQAVYDPGQFEKFMKEIEGLGVPVMVGIVLLKSAGMARFMNKSVAGVHVPDSLIEEMDAAENKRQKSIEIAARLINDMKDLCQGVHIMAIGWEKLVPAILDAGGL